MQPPKVAEFGWGELLDRQRELWLTGAAPSVESLLAGSPWPDDPDVRLDLIYNEIVAREESGQKFAIAEYLARYPQFAAELQLQLEIHRAIGDPSLLDEAVLETDRRQADESWPDTPRTADPGISIPPEYEWIRELGQGGNAVVYLARHRQLRREVALKMFRHGRLPTSRERLRFHSEATAFARVTHPNIIQIFAVGECEGLPFLALEFAAGGTLAQKLQDFPLEPRTAAELSATLARAVHHAHERQVIHRDLKPANILFTQEGTPKIADFGLAKIWDTDDVQSDMTRTGEAIGTPRYMAPEQTGGSSGRIGEAADVYALGTLLYECLTGRAPFIAPSVVDTIQKIRTEEPLSPRKLNPRLPRDLETICLRCLQKEPTRRYASAGDLADDLGRWLRGEPIHARPVPAWERVAKWCRRRPLEAAFVAAAFFLVAALAGGAVTAVQREQARLEDLRGKIAVLMRDGQRALVQDDHATAQSRFFDAWRIVESEPALSDHTPGVSGWLDHSRRAADKQLWQSRLPPREFDERRDEAIVESLLIEDRTPEVADRAREAVQSALDLTLDDPAWNRERELLTVLFADLLAEDQGAEKAVAYLDAGKIAGSRLFHLRRSELLQRLDRPAEAQAAQEQADTFPPDTTRLDFFLGLGNLREGDDAVALRNFERVLAAEPAFFAARLLQGVCFLRLDRAAEARVALTACVAQRPNFPWNHYFRSEAHRALEDIPAAEADWDLASHLKPSDTLQRLLHSSPVSPSSP